MAKMVDRVMDAMKHPKRIRNIAICAHIDHGKTTLSDNLLAGAGMMSHDLAGNARALDFHDDEAERGITIDSAAVSMVHRVKGEDYLINLIDTPGHVDFGGDVTRAMRAVDGCVVLCCAVEGIMPQTETVLRQALKEKVKPILFINKVDRMIKEQQLTPEAMQKKFVSIISHVNRLINAFMEEDKQGDWDVNVMNGSVCFGSAFHNWALSIDYMKEKNISFKDIINAYTDGDYKELASKAPLYDVLMNSVVKHLPDPVSCAHYRIPKFWRGDLESETGKALTTSDPNGPVMFVVTKVVIDPQAGEIAMGRLYSGTMEKGLTVKISGLSDSVRTQQIYIYNGAKREIVNKVPAGNIIGVGGLRGVAPGMTVSVGDQTPFESMKHIFDPVITKAIEAKNPADLKKLVDVLIQISKEDPSILVEVNQETGEHLISGMGELHLEIIENRIKTEKGVEVITSAPIVVYRETVRAKSPEPAEGKSPNKHNRLYFTAEPLDPNVLAAIKSGDIPSGNVRKKDADTVQALIAAGLPSEDARKTKDIFNGNILVDSTRGIVHVNEVMPMVIDMFRDVMNAGGLAHEPCFGVLIRLVDMKLHEDAIHRGPAQMYPAVRDGIRAAMSSAKPLLFEPVQTILFDAPEEYMGEISKLISNKRGQLLDMVQESGSIQVTGKLPVGEMFGLSTELRSATSGRGTSSLIDQGFEMLPMELQEKVKNQILTRKGLNKE